MLTSGNRGSNCKALRSRINPGSKFEFSLAPQTPYDLAIDERLVTFGQADVVRVVLKHFKKYAFR